MKKPENHCKGQESFLLDICKGSSNFRILPQLERSKDSLQINDLHIHFEPER